MRRRNLALAVSSVVALMSLGAESAWGAGNAAAEGHGAPAPSAVKVSPAKAAKVTPPVTSASLASAVPPPAAAEAQAETKAETKATEKAGEKAAEHGAPPLPSSASAGHQEATNVTPDEARAQLAEGNFRFIDGIVDAPRRDEARRTDTAANGQHPIAAVLSCADSRVPVEVIFDQGIGDIFTIRVAGNIAEPYALGSLEYGVEHLGIPLIVVMGHTKCGAVKAAVEGAQVEGNLGELIKEITPAAEEVKARSATLSPTALSSAAVRANVRLSMRNLIARSPVIAEAVSSGKVKVVGAVYDISGGSLQWVESGGSGVTAPPVAAAEPAAEEHAPVAPKAKAKAKVVAAAHGEPDAHGEAGAAHGEAVAEAPKKKKAVAKAADKHAAADEKETAEGHDEAAADESAEEGETKTAKVTVKKDNWMVLGAMGAGAMGLSFGVIQFMGKKKKKAAAEH